MPKFDPQVSPVPSFSWPLEGRGCVNPAVFSAIKDGQLYFGAFLLKDEHIGSDTDIDIAHPLDMYERVSFSHCNNYPKFFPRFPLHDWKLLSIYQHIFLLIFSLSVSIVVLIVLFASSSTLVWDYHLAVLGQYLIMLAELLLGDLATWRLLMNCIDLSMDGLIDFFVVDKKSVMTMIQLTSKDVALVIPSLITRSSASGAVVFPAGDYLVSWSPSIGS